MTLEDIKTYLREYDGREISLMEVCGSHTAAIAHLGIRNMLSPSIRLISGPGCPVCVTPSAYIDRLIELAKQPNHCVATFGDLIRVPGSIYSLNEAKGEGANVKMVYSPLDVLEMAEQSPEITFVFAAVGFETTTPVYALLLDSIVGKEIRNIKLLTALKTMPAAIDLLCGEGAAIDGFLAPGHVSVVTGSDKFRPLAEKYGIPFCVAGFKGAELLMAIYGLIRHCQEGIVMNYYPSAVTSQGNIVAQEKVNQYFCETSAVWRGLGRIDASGMRLREEYREYDAGSMELTEDIKMNKGCRCDKVLMGKLRPAECPLFRKHCTPMTPQGACMVSSEGSCYQYYINN